METSGLPSSSQTPQERSSDIEGALCSLVPSSEYPWEEDSMSVLVPLRLQKPDSFLGPHFRGMIKRALSFGDLTEPFVSPTHL